MRRIIRPAVILGAARGARFLPWGLAIFLAVVPGSARATAPIPSVAVTGTIRDADSHAPIAQVIVSIPSLHRTAITGPDGRYHLSALPGSYRVTVRRIGYASQSFDALLPLSGSLEIHLALQCQPILMPPIEVQSRVAVRGLEDDASRAFPDHHVSREALSDDPRLAEPDFLRAMSGGDVVLAPESPNGLHVRGGAADQVAYLVDDIPVINPFHAVGTFSALNPDALASVDLVTTSARADGPDVLSGVVEARTAQAGERISTRGSVSPTQARTTVDGPLGTSERGFLIGVGAAFPGLMFHKAEASHVGGEAFDALAKFESPWLGGRARVLGYGSHNEIETGTPASHALADDSGNGFAWRSGSLGATWERPLGEASLTLRAWTAAAQSRADWGEPDSATTVQSGYRDDGVTARITAPFAGGLTTLGVRQQVLRANTHTPVSTLFAEHGRALGGGVSIDAALSGAWALGHAFASPRAQIRWNVSQRVSLSGSAARRHQFSQSLRNTESVAATIFPAELWVVAGERGTPVANSNIGVIAVEHRPRPNVRLALQGWMRDFGGLVLVAPLTANAAGDAGFTTGSGTARGVSLEAGMSRTRLGFIAGYGYQHVRLSHAGGRYVPGYGAAHTFEAGITYLPVPTTRFRLGFESAFGRRTTSTLGNLEYESVNLLDQGAEFAGSPGVWSEPLGGTALPAYLRIDLGVRKQWRTRLADRDGFVAVFGTFSNLLGRSNTLTRTVDTGTGLSTPVEMRPFSPLVVGVDWQF
jgi:hypothetical protein